MLLLSAAGICGLSGCAGLGNGDYSCLNPESFKYKLQAEEIRAPYVYNFMEDQWIATVSGGQLTEVTIVPGKSDPLAQTEYIPAANFSLVKQIDRNAMQITVEGKSAVCWK